MPVPDLTDRRHPYIQIADDVQAKIAAGRYGPGDKLPSNAQMREEYGSSKQTVTNAVRELEARGLVATHSTRGAFVLSRSAWREPGTEAVPADAALQAVLAHLTRHDGEIAKLREELEYVQAQVEALDDGRAGTASLGRSTG